ncbi:hypothetical protein ABI59_01875 [Acidobacteria bacterium Mor1]|nr:hypothetical protein ABI59_01875 [Acidobacteria bacterium Mor1]
MWKFLSLAPSARLGLVLALLACLATPGLAQGVSDPRILDALEQYDAGNYPAARQMLEAIDTDGLATGPLLYRLYFSKSRTGDQDGARHTLIRAIEVLEDELLTATDYETPFYLANAYSNARQSGQARRVAVELTGKVEQGSIPKPATGLDTFRLAKLYADQSEEAKASQWYRKALELFAGKEAEQRAYVAWARRYLGSAAFSKADYKGAAAEYTALHDAGIASQRDLNRLGVAHYRLGDMASSQKTWDQSAALNPSSEEANTARYSSNLARMALETELADRAPEDRSWGSLSQTDLEDLMKDQAEVVQSTQAAFKSGELTDAAAAQDKIDGARRVFVKAALEYVARNFPIRATSFQGGYAPLIFRSGPWKIPVPRKNATRPMKPKQQGADE